MKKNKLNYFQMMDKKAAESTQKPAKAPRPANGAIYKEVQKAPILDVKLSPAEEDAQYKACLDYALKMSSDDDKGRITIYMDMSKTLHFDMMQDQKFQNLWKAKELLCLIDIPKNWKTMILQDIDEEDEEDYDLSNPMERFDYLYETGMRYCED